MLKTMLTEPTRSTTNTIAKTFLGKRGEATNLLVLIASTAVAGRDRHRRSNSL